MIELKPCPFCGGKAAVLCERKMLTLDRRPIFAVECRVGCDKCKIYFRQTCGVSETEYKAPTAEDKYEEAVEMWNRRVNDEV